MKKITLILSTLLILGGSAIANEKKACCKKDAKVECSKEKKEACEKGEGCCSKSTSKKSKIKKENAQVKTNEIKTNSTVQQLKVKQ